MDLLDVAGIWFFLLFGMIFVAGGIIANKFLGPRKPNPIKLSNYECGERPVGSPWVRFNIRYYIIAIIFLVFEMEIVFLLPCAVKCI